MKETLRSFFYNPIFVLGLRLRLRRKHLIGWGIVTLSIATFLFLLTYENTLLFPGFSKEKAARGAFLSIFVFQCILLMFFGTQAIASGIAQEKDSDTLFFQRLTPLPPLQKIVGYLFGLTSREYVLFFLTVPFSVFSVVVGKLDFQKIAVLYLVLFSTVVMYHMFGFVSGMVTSKVRKASWIAMILVLGLYTLSPTLSQYGFNFFGFLTILPTLYGSILEDLFGLFRASRQASMLQQSAYWKETFWFTWRVTPAVYTLCLQGAITFTCFVVVYRKWRDENAPIFSKPFAIVFYTIIQILLLGSLWPFLTRESVRERFYRHLLNNHSNTEIGLQLSILFVFISFSIFFFIVYSLTPSFFDYLKGLRRAKKKNQKQIPWRSQHFPIFQLAGFLTLITIAFSLILGNTMIQQGFFRLKEGDWNPLILFFSVLFFTFMSLSSLRSLLSKRGFFFALFCVWAIPILVAILLLSAWKEYTWAAYFFSMTPLGGFFFSIFHLFWESSTFSSFKGISSTGSFNNYTLFSMVFNACLFFVSQLLLTQKYHELRVQESQRSHALLAEKKVSVDEEEQSKEEVAS